MEFSTENLKVGDKVIVHGTGFGMTGRDYVGVIVKKTPTGLVDVQIGNQTPVRFKSNGEPYAREDIWSRYKRWLKYWSEDEDNQIAREENQRAMIKYLKEVEFSKMSYEDLEQVYDLVKNIENKRN